MSAIIIIDNQPTEVSDDACREIMRLRSENAALRDAIEESEEFARKNGEACGSKIRELLAENAALREEMESLKSALEALAVSSMEKEAQP